VKEPITIAIQKKSDKKDRRGEKTKKKGRGWGKSANETFLFYPRQPSVGNTGGVKDQNLGNVQQETRRKKGKWKLAANYFKKYVWALRP